MTIVLHQFTDNTGKYACIETMKESKRVFLSVSDKYNNTIYCNSYVSENAAIKTIKRLFPGMNEYK